MAKKAVDDSEDSEEEELDRYGRRQLSLDEIEARAERNFYELKKKMLAEERLNSPKLSSKKL